MFCLRFSVFEHLLIPLRRSLVIMNRRFRQQNNNSGNPGPNKGLLGTPPQTFPSSVPSRSNQPLLGSHPTQDMSRSLTQNPMGQNMQQGMGGMGGFSGGMIGVGGNQLGVVNDMLLNAVSAAANQQHMSNHPTPDMTNNFNLANQFQNISSPRGDVPSLMSLPQQQIARPPGNPQFMSGPTSGPGGLLGMQPQQPNRAPTMPQQQTVSFVSFDVCSLYDICFVYISPEFVCHDFTSRNLQRWRIFCTVCYY